MDKRILKKILEELNKDNPRIDYIKGMLEVLIGEDEPEVIKSRDELAKDILTNGSTTTYTNNDPDLPPAPNFRNVAPPTDD
jgi:hypothetical protein